MRAPRSTYRLQITADFDLHTAAARLPYLHDLGADWVYLSPILEAEADSDHGYDVLRHDRIDPVRGGPEGLAALSAEARRLGMGVLVDIVPNHVGVATPTEGTWWWDLLAGGRESRAASYFDVDWPTGDGKVLIPIVGDDDFGAIVVGEDDVTYHDHRFPLAEGTSTLEEQHYRLVSWRDADDKLNYRRFFAVNTLAAIRVEDPQVFADSHVEIKRWFDEDLVDGLRVDHPDGLRDPGWYLDDLVMLTGGAYVLVEKILEPGEELLSSWATSGTTGYDAMAMLDRVLTDPAGQRPLDALESRLRGVDGPIDFRAMIHDTKRAVADGILGSETRRIVRDLTHEPVREFSAAGTPIDDGVLVDAVAELLACFPVYRSYLPDGRGHLDQALVAALQHRPDLTPALTALEPALSDPDLAGAKRFQQTSGMVMAKGVEDCAFYRYSRLTSLNEVGGDPGTFSMSVTAFHDAMAVRQDTWPDAMTSLSTHDTKRGEDVRARITALAEIPAVWATHLDQLLTLVPMPDPGFASLLWQAVIGAWPAEPHRDRGPLSWRARLHGYAEKAMREAGGRTTWTAPDQAYERAVHAAVDAAIDEKQVRHVLAEILEHVVAPGWSNSMSLKLLALTMPGVPDVYQGSELWEQSLVDPDNRRPVNFGLRSDLLGPVRDGAGMPLTSSPDDGGLAKLKLVHTALTLRRDRAELFTTYAPLTATGQAAAHVLAFDRGGAVTVATRLPIGLTRLGGWGGTMLDLPAGTWQDRLSGRSFVSDGSVPMGALLTDLPVALLVTTGTRPA